MIFKFDNGKITSTLTRSGQVRFFHGRHLRLFHGLLRQNLSKYASLVPGDALVFYRSWFILIVSITRLRLKNKRLFPDIIKPLIIRNSLEILAILSMFISVKFVPISTFMVIFNSKGVLIYVFETVLKRRLPPTTHIVCCLVCFVGMIMVVSPSVDLSSQASISETLGVLGCLVSTSFIGMSDVYLNHISECHQAIDSTETKIWCFSGFSADLAARSCSPRRPRRRCLRFSARSSCLLWWR